MRGRRLVPLVVAALFLAGCGKDPAPAYDGVEPQYATGWMEQVTLDYRVRASKETTFAPVTVGGRTYVGDPTQYEAACGATFLLDGEMPELYAGIHGEPPGDNPDPTYYRWLQSDPKRWSAFNAWLYDPAIVALLDNTPDSTLGKTRAERIGTTKDCPDADRAGVLAS